MTLLATASIAAAQVETADGSVPVLARMGPYGDPFRLLPRGASLADIAAPPNLTASPNPITGLSAGGPASRSGARAAGDPDAPVSGLVGQPTERDPVAPPGTFAMTPIQVPSRFFKDPRITPHLAPDVEVGLDERSSLGMFGDVGRTDARLPPPTRTARDPAATRDVGAGLTFQYKFGH